MRYVFIAPRGVPYTWLRAMQAQTRTQWLKLGNLYLGVKWRKELKAYYNPEDSTLTDLVAYAVANRKFRLLERLVEMFGVRLQSHSSTNPCSSKFTMTLSITLTKVEVLMRRVKRKKLPSGAGRETDREEIYLARDDRGNGYLVYEWEYDGWDVHDSWWGKEVYILPLQPVRLKIIEEGLRVVCGPDGYAEPYRRERIVEFPARLYK